MKRAKQMGKNEILVINLSGRGDKDVNQVAKLLGVAL
jgi:tryptophan synthase beta chain